jgi:hypothetical protein
VLETPIQHKPWVGDRFKQSLTTKLMILGESHHGPDPDAIDVTELVVEEWLSGVTNPSYRFFTHLSVALSGREPWQIDRRDVFGSVAFYNYVQRVLPEARISPSREDFVTTEPAFRAVIEMLRPTHVVACGGRLWENLPPFDPPDSDGWGVTLADAEFHIGRYHTANAAPLAMCIRHPQAGFNGRTWFPRLRAFVAN